MILEMRDSIQHTGVKQGSGWYFWRTWWKRANWIAWSADLPWSCTPFHLGFDSVLEAIGAQCLLALCVEPDLCEFLGVDSAGDHAGVYAAPV